MPIAAAAAGVGREQGGDVKDVADLTVADVRRQIAFATADAYLTIITQRRVVEANLRARDVAKAHFDLATELERQGTGSHLNALRAQQQVSIDEGLVEAARLGLYRAQEALGVLIAADGPADAADEPTFAVPGEVASTVFGVSTDRPSLLTSRTDLKLFSAPQQA